MWKISGPFTSIADIVLFSYIELQVVFVYRFIDDVIVFDELLLLWLHTQLILFQLFLLHDISEVVLLLATFASIAAFSDFVCIFADFLDVVSYNIDLLIDIVEVTFKFVRLLKEIVQIGRVNTLATSLNYVVGLLEILHKLELSLNLLWLVLIVVIDHSLLLIVIIIVAVEVKFAFRRLIKVTVAALDEAFSIKALAPLLTHAAFVLFLTLD